MRFKSVAAILFASLTFFALAGCGGGGGESPSANARATVLAAPAESADLSPVSTVVPLVPLATPPSNVKSRSVGARPIPSVIQLGAPEADMSLLKSATPGQLQIGFRRELPKNAASSPLMQTLAWQSRPGDVMVTALSVKSSTAVAVRIGMKIARLPQDAKIRVYSQTSDSMIELDAREIMAAIYRNIDADGDTDEARTYWLPSVEGDECTVEVEVPNSAEVRNVDITFPAASHYFLSPKSDTMLKTNVSGSCNVDVNCSSGYATEQNAVAKMEYVKFGSAYICTGTLLTDRRNTFTPFFLTANHCISTQSAATSLTTYWFYKSASCGSVVLNPGTKTLTGGATLLYAAAATDTSFLRLNTSPPTGAAFAGWDPGAPTLAQSVAAIHHPNGDLQKYSEGATTAYQACTATGDTTSSQCSSTSVSSASTAFLAVGWSRGVTETGSSGSGLFKRNAAGNYLIGQLFAGASACSNQTGKDTYGRFDIAYNAALKNWLTGGTRDAVYRFYNPGVGAHFYTISAAERDQVIANYPGIYSYEGPVFYAYKAVDETSAPASVYRFYNNRTRAHFFTISAAERDSVIAKYPFMNYEGTAWYASSTSSGNSIPLYRFFNNTTQTHFYTASLAERNFAIANYPNMSYEGIGYNVWSSN